MLFENKDKLVTLNQMREYGKTLDIRYQNDLLGGEIFNDGHINLSWNSRGYDDVKIYFDGDDIDDYRALQFTLKFTTSSLGSLEGYSGGLYVTTMWFKNVGSSWQYTQSPIIDCPWLNEVFVYPVLDSDVPDGQIRFYNYGNSIPNVQISRIVGWREAPIKEAIVE